MKILESAYTITDAPDKEEAYAIVAEAAKVTRGGKSKKSNVDIIEMLLKKGHESVLEHVNVTVAFLCSRSIANQIVRHRVASFTQESTRFVDYKEGIRVINPGISLTKPEFKIWHKAMNEIDARYKELRAAKLKKEIARDVLPLCTATKLVVTANIREWRHIIKLRTAPDAQQSLRAIIFDLGVNLYNKYPLFFKDIMERITCDETA